MGKDLPSSFRDPINSLTESIGRRKVLLEGRSRSQEHREVGFSRGLLGNQGLVECAFTWQLFPTAGWDEAPLYHWRYGKMASTFNDHSVISCLNCSNPNLL